MSKATHLVSGRNGIWRHTHPVQSPCHLLIVTLAPFNICTRIHLQIAFLFLIILCAMPSSKNCLDTLMPSKRKTMKNQYSGWFLLPSKNQTQCKWFNIGREQTDTRKKKKCYRQCVSDTISQIILFTPLLPNTPYSPLHFCFTQIWLSQSPDGSWVIMGKIDDLNYSS